LVGNILLALHGNLGGNPGQFDESSLYYGWLRDYLWLNSSPLINGYNPFGMNNLSVWTWMFLFGHLVWATGFMFLISCGYWQELIETLVWAHERTPLANLIRETNQLLFQLCKLV
jgi:photosystem I P700 chlorophyll a apoprotein A2